MALDTAHHLAALAASEGHPDYGPRIAEIYTEVTQSAGGHTWLETLRSLTLTQPHR